MIYERDNTNYWESLENKNITIRNGETTPIMRDGMTIIVGYAPTADTIAKSGEAAGTVKIEDPRLEGLLSRQAVLIAYMEEPGVRVRSYTDANIVRVWSVDRDDYFEAELHQLEPLGDEIWAKIGRKPNIEIEMADRLFLTLRSIGSHGEYRVEISNKPHREGQKQEEFVKLN